MSAAEKAKLKLFCYPQFFDPMDENISNLKSGRRRSSPFFLEKGTASLTRFEEVIQLTSSAHTGKVHEMRCEFQLYGLTGRNKNFEQAVSIPAPSHDNSFPHLKNLWGL